MTIATIFALIFGVPYGCDFIQGNGPMIVYGRVIDQTGKPITDAPVNFMASANPRFQLPFPLAKPRRAEWQVSATTDHDGYFYLNGGRGLALYALRVGELGFEKGAIPNNFYFGRRSDGNIYHPDSKNPTVFMWWNDVYKRIVSKTATCRPKRDDGCTLAFLSGAMTNSEGAFEQLEIFVQRPPAGTATPFDWGVDVRALDGGLVETEAKLGPEAPDAGYEPKKHYFVSAKDPHWSLRLLRRFYTRNHGYEIGKPIYAGVELEVVLDANDANPTVTARYTADFGNSRDLTPGPVMPAKK
jgi:hypothetical protein